MSRRRFGPGLGRRNSIALMTDRTSSLTPKAMHEIIAHLDDALRVLDRESRNPAGQQRHLRNMLLTVRGQLLEQVRSANGDNPPRST